MHILGIDPSVQDPAYCIMSDKEVINYGKILLQEMDSWARLISEADLVAIETQYVGLNPRSAIKLSFCAGMLAGVASLLGKEIMPVSPKRWQAKMLKAKAKSGREVLKHLSKEIASAIVNEKINDSDIADAILICEYARQKIANGGLTK